jgi:hypothetical protein
MTPSKEPCTESLLMRKTKAHNVPLQARARSRCSFKQDTSGAPCLSSGVEATVRPFVTIPAAAIARGTSPRGREDATVPNHRGSMGPILEHSKSSTEAVGT